MQILLPALILGAGATIIELRTVFSLGWLRSFIAKHPIFGLLMSFVMTGFLGSLFGAAGVTIMLGSVIAIVATGCAYRIDRTCKNLSEWNATRKIGA